MLFNRASVAGDGHTMHTELPDNAPLQMRLRAFADFLDNRLATWEARIEARVEKDDGYARLKTERAELSVIRARFRGLFEHDL